MMNEISRNTLGVMLAQPKGESEKTSQVQVSQVSDSSSEKSNGTPAAVVSETAKSVAVDEKQLAEMVQELNGFAQTVQRQLQFSVDKDNGEVVVKVVDAKTKDVIREIPPEEIRNMQKQLNEVNDKLFHKREGTSLLFQGKA